MKRRRPKLIAVEYPPGHFSRCAFAWLGPRGWTPQGALPRPGNVTNTSDRIPPHRGGWGNNTIVGLSEKADRMLAERGQ